MENMSQVVFVSLVMMHVLPAMLAILTTVRAVLLIITNMKAAYLKIPKSVWAHVLLALISIPPFVKVRVGIIIDCISDC